MDDILRKLVSHAWSVSVKYNRDNTIRRVDLCLKDTVTGSPKFVEETVKLLAEFAKTAPGALGL